MPASSACRAESSITAQAIGTKKLSSAISQMTSALGPAAAAVAIQRGLATATTRNSVVSARPIVRRSPPPCGTASAVMRLELFDLPDRAQHIPPLRQEALLRAGRISD